MIQYKKFTKAQGKEFVENIDKLSDAAFNDLTVQWSSFNVEGFDDSYSELRQQIIDTYKQYSDAGGYEIDVRVGLCLYAYLNTKNGFTTVLANDDDIWRYLSCKVFPDITNLRYPPSKTDQNEGHRVNTKRFLGKDTLVVYSFVLARNRGFNISCTEGFRNRYNQ